MFLELLAAALAGHLVYVCICVFVTSESGEKNKEGSRLYRPLGHLGHFPCLVRVS